jgi:hypothetical protein
MKAQQALTGCADDLHRSPDFNRQLFLADWRGSTFRAATVAVEPFPKERSSSGKELTRQRLVIS